MRDEFHFYLASYARRILETTPHLTVDDILELTQSDSDDSPNDPRWQHLDVCSQCLDLLLATREFFEPDPDP